MPPKPPITGTQEAPPLVDCCQLYVSPPVTEFPVRPRLTVCPAHWVKGPGGVIEPARGVPAQADEGNTSIL